MAQQEDVEKKGREEILKTEEQIRALEKEGKYGLAGGVAERAGMTERAIEDLEKAGIHEGAARVAEKAGMTERAIENYKRAIENCEKAGVYINAAYVAERAGMTERAIEDFEKAGRHDEAARIARKVELTEKAIVLEKAGEKSEGFKVGGWVRVKSSVKNPRFDWAGIQPSDIGKIVGIHENNVYIDFPSQKQWHGIAEETEAVSEEEAKEMGKEPLQVFLHHMEGVNTDGTKGALKRFFGTERRLIFYDVNYELVHYKRITKPITGRFEVKQATGLGGLLTKEGVHFLCEKEQYDAAAAAGYTGLFVSMEDLGAGHPILLADKEYQRKMTELTRGLSKDAINAINRTLLCSKNPSEEFEKIETAVKEGIYNRFFLPKEPREAMGTEKAKKILSAIKKRHGEKYLEYTGWLDSKGMHMDEYSDYCSEVYSLFPELREELSKEEVVALAGLVEAFDKKGVSRQEREGYLKMIGEVKKGEAKKGKGESGKK
jgi:tetratricopeptide (TPR) repeat protein